MNKAIFLDRDGTLIEEKNYLSDKKDIKFLDGVFDALQILQQQFLLIIITNQSGVARGYFNEDKVIEINEKLIDSPEMLNEDCFENGWLIKVEHTAGNNELEDLMSYTDYKEELE